MKSETEAACREFAEKLEQAWTAAARACRALGEDPEFAESVGARRIDPSLVGGLKVAHGLAMILPAQAEVLAFATFMAGSQNGPAWRRAVDDDVGARCEKLKDQCSCGECQFCSAREAAVQRAIDVARAASS
ncbi:hypothetical protein [Sorangium sp. So ce128]|uniref:hypothetical protein n=1 Tax=Sorangium sp. So ce128 TaxID=3133281 RepID=UPI003F6315A4